MCGHESKTIQSWVLKHTQARNSRKHATCLTWPTDDLKLFTVPGQLIPLVGWVGHGEHCAAFSRLGRLCLLSREPSLRPPNPPCHPEREKWNFKVFAAKVQPVHDVHAQKSNIAYTVLAIATIAQSADLLEVCLVTQRINWSRSLSSLQLSALEWNLVLKDEWNIHP